MLLQFVFFEHFRVSDRPANFMKRILPFPVYANTQNS